MNFFRRKKVRVRFAPSPTGFMHLGGLRTALINYLFAKHHGGSIILRIEDTDQARTVPGAIKNIIETLEWAGLNYDEGPVQNGDVITDRGKQGPYLQSRRLDIYKKYADQLVASGHAYRCFCTPVRLEEMRAEQNSRKQPPMYDGLCRSLEADEVKRKLDEHIPSVIRMKVPREGSTALHDLVHGDITFKNDLIDDQVLLKSDGFPTYHLAVVVDDHLMEVSHCIRGEDWLPSTPKHLLLYTFFGWKSPEFAHIPLLLKEGGGKLSKRELSQSVQEYIKSGYLKEALLNFVALLGWRPEGQQEIMSMREMIRIFDLTHVNRAGAIFLPEKLNWMNGMYIRALHPKEFADQVRPYLLNAGLITHDFPPLKLEKIVSLEQQRIKKLADINDAVSFVFLSPKPEKNMLCWKTQSADGAAQKLSALQKILEGIEDQKWSAQHLEQIVKDVIATSGGGAGETLWPMRVALSGRSASPGPFEIAAALGKEESLVRIQKAITILTA